MIMLLTASTGLTLTEAFTGGSLLGLAIYGAVKHKKIQQIKIK